MSNTYIPYHNISNGDSFNDLRYVFIREYDEQHYVYIKMQNRSKPWITWEDKYQFDTDEEAVRKAKYLASKYDRQVRRS